MEKISWEVKKSIKNTFCRDDRPSSICWAGGPVQGRLVVRGRVNVVMEVGINK